MLNEKHKKIVSTVSIIMFLIFAAFVTYYVGKPLIRFVSEPDKFRDWVNSHGVWGKLGFVGMVFFQVVLALIPGEPLEICAGYAFGAFWGTVLTVIGTVLGSVAVFYFVRILGVKLCEVFFSHDKILSLKILQNKKRRAVLTFLIFFLPGTPKDLVTYFLGLTDIRLVEVIFLSGVARLPSIITSTLGGDALGVKKYSTALLVFGTTLAVSCIGFYIYNKILIKKQAGKEQNSA